MDKVDCIIAGAGVVGLAIARALARRGIEVLVLEPEEAFGTGTSSRNSEVIHAGIYYPTGSLKAQLCVEGKARLYAYARAFDVPHRRCGKLIVATDAAQVAALEGIRARAEAAGVTDLRLLSEAEARAMEPRAGLQGGAALAIHGHRRQPRADAVAAGAGGTGRRAPEPRHAGRRGPGDGAGL